MRGPQLFRSFCRIPGGKKPFWLMMSGCSCGGRFAGTTLKAILPEAGSNDPSWLFCSCHGARYSQRSPIWSVSLELTCQLSSTNGAIVGEVSSDRELPNAPVHVEQ